MAEEVRLRNSVLPYPIFGVPYSVTFPIRDSTGNTIASGSGLTAVISLNGNTSTTVANTVTEIANSGGLYFLIFNSTEMSTDIASATIRSTSTGAVPTVLTLYPRKLPVLRANTANTGNATTITLDTGAPSMDDYFTGCVVAVTIGSNTFARMITSYTGATKLAAVTPNFSTNANSSSTFSIYNPEGRPLTPTNVLYVGNTTMPGTQDGYTFAQTFVLMASALLGKASGLATTNAVYRSLDDSKNRISANVTISGDRLEVTRDGS